MKAQIQMMETIVILLVVFIMAGIGIIFFSTVMTSDITDKMEQYDELSRIEISQMVTTLPELQCSLDNIVRSNCIDMLRLKHFVLTVDKNYYFDIFGFSNVTVTDIFPGHGSWQIYSRIPDEFETKTKNYFPVSIYDPVSDENHFGILTVEVFK